MKEYKNHSGHLSEEAIAGYVQQKLSSEEMYAIEKHLLNCAFCADAVDGYEAFADIDISQSNAKLNDKLQSRTKKRTKKIGYYRLGIAASITLLLAFSVFYLFDVIDNNNGDIAINTQEEIKNTPTGIEEKLAEELEVVSNDSNKITESENENNPIPKAEKSVAKKAARVKKIVSSERKKSKQTEREPYKNTKNKNSLIALTDNDIINEPLVEVLESDELVSSDASINDAGVNFSFAESELAQSDTQEEEVSDALVLPKSKTARRLAQEDSPSLSEKRITGTVHDNNGNAIPGVNVILKNTSKGTTTDINGKYSLAVSEEYNELLFSFIGMEAVAMNIDAKEVIDVTMDADASELSEVVVVSAGSINNEVLRDAYPIGGHNQYREYLESSLQYPQIALDNRVEGVVRLQLDINKKGNISNITVLDSLAYGCNQEAIRLVNEGANWKPAKEGGKKMESKVILNVVFKLKE